MLHILGATRQPPAIVTAYCHNGTLLSMFTQAPIPIRIMYEILKGIASGMHHLHRFEIKWASLKCSLKRVSFFRNGVLHTNLCARNIFVTPQNQPLISDYGKDSKNYRFLKQLGFPRKVENLIDFPHGPAR